MNLILLTGMPGARKSDVANIMASFGNYSINMSDIIKKELITRNEQLTSSNYQKCAKEMRRFYGPTILARKTLELLQDQQTLFCVIDGLRTLDEYTFLRENSDFARLIAVHAASQVRYARMKQRSGPELQRLKQLKLLDQQNLNLGIGEIIALSDYVIVNGDYLDLDLIQFTRLVYGAILKELESSKI